MNNNNLQERLCTVQINMTQERAQEIVNAIHADKWQWQGNTDKFFREGERAEVIKKWKTMPGYTCFADALYRIAKGE